MNYSMPQYLRKNPDIHLQWLGWETSLARLAQSGWDISMHQNPAQGFMQVAIRFEHPNARVYGMTNVFDYDYWEAQNPQTLNSYRILPAQYINLAQSIEFRVMERLAFQPVETYPAIEPISHTANDFFAFKRISPQCEGIVLPEPNLMEILEMARKMQEPKQRELREKYLREQQMQQYGMRPAGEIRANLLLAA